MATTLGRSTRNWKTRVRSEVLGRSDICHWCGHPGSDEVDHYPIPYAILVQLDPRATEDPDNCAPIHGLGGCPICPPVWSKRLRRMVLRKCNQEKGAKVGAPPAEGSRPW